MGIHSVVLHFMLAANQHKPIIGNYLSVGKQSVMLNEAKISRLLRYYKCPPMREGATDFETRRTIFNVSDHDLLRSFSSAKYNCLDKSDYETANEILDLNVAHIPARLKNNFEFIYDGGTLDNVFSPAQAIINLSSMLSIGGRILNFNLSSGWPGVYTAPSCEWLFSYYAVNNFVNVKIFLLIPVTLPRYSNWPDPSFHVYSYSPYFTRDPEYNPLIASMSTSTVGSFVIGIAERAENSSVNKIPIQSHYLLAGETDWREKYWEYQQSQIYSLHFDANTEKKIKALPFKSDHYFYMGDLS